MIVDPLDYTRGVGDDDIAFLKKMKKIEKEKSFVTIKAQGLEIKTTNPEKYSEYNGEYIFTINKKIKPKEGEVLSYKDGVTTIRVRDYKTYKSIIENL